MPEEVSGDDLKALEGLTDVHKRLKGEVAKVIVGQERVIDLVLISLLCRGHSLLIGVPGLAKTLLVKTLAQMLDLHGNHLQEAPGGGYQVQIPLEGPDLAIGLLARNLQAVPAGTGDAA